MTASCELDALLNLIILVNEIMYLYWVRVRGVLWGSEDEVIKVYTVHLVILDGSLDEIDIHIKNNFDFDGGIDFRTSSIVKFNGNFPTAFK